MLNGPNTIGQIGGLTGFSVLANKIGFSYKPGGVTFDWSTVAAETVSRTLPGGFVTSVGDKVLEAGSTIYAITTGSPTSKYGVALAATTLVRGETFMTERHFVQSIDVDQLGEVFDNGNVIQARVKAGGALATLANIKAHFTRMTFLQG